MDSISPIIQFVGAFGLGSVIVAVIGVFGARKLNQANVVAKSVESADIQIENAERERDYFRTDRDVERERANREATKVRAWWARADTHAAWDRRQVTRLQEAGVHDAMPPLYPPDGE